jgi:hypothetical protein
VGIHLPILVQIVDKLRRYVNTTSSECEKGGACKTFNIFADAVNALASGLEGLDPNDRIMRRDIYNQDKQAKWQATFVQNFG